MASDDEPLWLTEVYAMFKGARKRDYLVLDEGASPTQRREKERERKKKKPRFSHDDNAGSAANSAVARKSD